MNKYIGYALIDAVRKLAQENYNPKAFDNIEPENKS